MKPRIAIDAHMVGEQETGNETYTLNLIRALLPLGRDHHYLLYTTHPKRLASRLPLPVNAEIVTIRPNMPLLRIPWAMPRTNAAQKAALLHVNYIAPPFNPCPVVTTVHDISYEFFPSFFSPRDRWLLKTLVPFTARRAARVIAVSECTKNDLVARYGLPPEKITVTYEAAGEQFRPIEEPVALRAVRARYGLRMPFIFALGNLQPRKNILRLLAAYIGLRRAGVHVQLLIGGKAKWRESELFRAVTSYGMGQEILFPGYVPDEDLPLLYNAAACFAFPALYEGFGLPPLEAMACGTPVVCSNVASLPEVVGDAARLVDPGDVDDITQALVEVMMDAGLRAELRARGLRRAQRFSWRRCAEETAQVYEEVLAEQRGAG